MILNEYFDHVYCLSLTHSVDRRSVMQKKAQEVGLRYSYYPGIYGSLLTNVYEAVKKAGATDILNANYMACALSHLSIYKDALNRGRKNILILEDDLLFHREINEKFTSIKPQIPENWDLLYLAWIPLSDSRIEWDYRVINDQIISSGIIKAKNLWSCMAYGITDTMMHKTIELFDFSKEIDRFFVEDIQPNYNCYGIRPQLFAGYDNLSNNTNRYDSIFKRSFDNRVATVSDYL